VGDCGALLRWMLKRWFQGILVRWLSRQFRCVSFFVGSAVAGASLALLSWEDGRCMEASSQAHPPGPRWHPFLRKYGVLIDEYRLSWFYIFHFAFDVAFAPWFLPAQVHRVVACYVGLRVCMRPMISTGLHVLYILNYCIMGLFCLGMAVHVGQGCKTCVHCCWR